MLFKIQTIQLPQDNQCLWDRKLKVVLICGYDDAQHFCFGGVSQSWEDFLEGKGVWSWRCCVAPCDLWRSHIKMRKEHVCSHETSMHWENSGPKQAAWTQKNKSPPLNSHTNITPFKPIYKHYLYFVHTLVHAHTHSHWACSCLVTLVFQISIIENGLCCCY